MSEYAREQIVNSMMVDKNKDDIDFIRKQIREELKSVLDSYSNRIIKLLIKIGTMTVSMCYFTSKLLYVLVSYHKDRINYDEMFEEAKRKAGAFLGIKDQSIDEITKSLLDD